MSSRRVFDNALDAHFVTFSCYKRRRYLDLDRTKQTVIGTLGVQLHRLDGLCTGFVVMPNHVHAVVWFPELGRLSGFLDAWKTEASKSLKENLRDFAPHYMETLPTDDSVWQARYYDFNLFTDGKLAEKLDYMHANPVRWGLVQRAAEWRWSSARWYLDRRSVGVEITVPPGVM